MSLSNADDEGSSLIAIPTSIWTILAWRGSIENGFIILRKEMPQVRGIATYQWVKLLFQTLHSNSPVCSKTHHSRFNYCMRRGTTEAVIDGFWWFSTSWMCCRTWIISARDAASRTARSCSTSVVESSSALSVLDSLGPEKRTDEDRGLHPCPHPCLGLRRKPLGLHPVH